jgi:hypothetical protein
MWLRLESRRLGIFPNLAEAYQRGPIPPEELGPKHRLHDLLPDFEHALTSRGLSVTLAQRHVLNCRRVFYVLAAAGGADAQVTAASVNAAISTLRDRKTGKLFNGATRTHYRQSVTRLFDLLGHKTLELGQHSTIDLKVKEQALEPRHRLTDLLADFTDALIDQGLKAPRAKRHADRCQRVFSALAEAGGVDADASPEAIDAVVSAFRDKQTGDELNQESRQLYHQSVRRFFKVMKDKIVVGMESPALV